MRTDQPRPIRLEDYRPSAFLIDSAALGFELHPTRTKVTSRLSLRRNPLVEAGQASLKLDGENIELAAVSLNGKALAPPDYAVTEKALTIESVPQEPFTVEIVTVGDPQANTALSGLYRASGVYCTQCEPEGFRRITYYLDRPDILAKFRVRLEASKTEAPVLLSNGNLIEEGDLPRGRHFAVWEDPFPKPSYLFALVAGTLASVTGTFTTASGRNVDLAIYVEPGKEDRCAWAMQSLKKAMRWDEDRFGLEYDLDRFMIVAVSDFNMGAMENKGLNIFNDALILARPDTATDFDYASIEGVIAHEYFHNWTGNRVTCRDWFQLCLKEGLTVFRDQEFTADIRSRVVKRIEDVRLLKTAQFPVDAGPLSHPVRPSAFIEINNFYTTTVYEKGAELCRMLNTMLGQDNFRRGLDLYFKRHDGKAVTVEDFLGAMGDANETDLRPFLLWYTQPGTPKLEAKLVYSAAGKRARLTLAQSYPEAQPASARKPVPIPVKLGLLGSNGSDLPLKLNGKPLHDGLIVLDKAKEVFTFEDVGERPVPSILRGFSAPVSLTQTLPDRDAMILLRSDSDLFNRWQAAQAFALKHIVEIVIAAQEGRTLKPNARFIAALGEVAASDALEHEYRAAFLTLPGDKDIALAIGENVDPGAVSAARSAVRAAAGRRLRKLFEAVYAASAPAEPYSPDPQNAGRRSLQRTVLGLLATGGSRFAIAEVKRLTQNATNMTEAMAGLTILSQENGAAYAIALRRFYRQWKGERLVMDKWFSVQARSPHPSTVALISELSRHPLFSIANPNRVRALYGAFAHGNQLRFNDASGEGYRIVAHAVAALDKLNPQVAAALASAFESWRVFEPGRRALAEAALQGILATGGLSAGVFEIASKILDGPHPAASESTVSL